MAGYLWTWQIGLGIMRWDQKLWHCFYGHFQMTIETTIPVDLHVFLFMQSLGLTNAKSEEECSWQMKLYAPKEDFIRINNSIVGIGQTMASQDGRKQVMAATKRIAPIKFMESMKKIDSWYAKKV